MKQIKAIDTAYKDYLFRSRLEARWAYFFDLMGIKWEYEPQGFELKDCTKYLPDFRATGLDGRVFWYEIKPLITKEDPKFSKFFREVRTTTLRHEAIAHASLLSGDPVDVFLPEVPQVHRMCPVCGYIAVRNNDLLNVASTGAVAQSCMACFDHSVQRNVRSGGAGLFTGAFAMIDSYHISYSKEDLMKHALKVQDAAIAARSARFEHGEVPA